MSDEDKEEDNVKHIVIPYHPRPWQRDMHRKLKRFNVLPVHRGAGKGLALDTPLVTPSGFTSMGDIKVDDQLIDRDGNVCIVTAVSEIHHLPCYEIEFNTGEVIVCDEAHLWLTQSGNERDVETNRKRRMSVPSSRYKALTESAKTAAYIAATLEDSYVHIRHGSRQKNHRIRVVPPVQFSEHDLPLDPYVFGYWLGDGDSRGCKITVGDKDRDAFILKMAERCMPVRKITEAISYRIGVNGRNRGNREACVKVLLRVMGVLENKHIPMVYLRASETQRWLLLQGIMDSDGYTGKSGNCEITLSNRRLIEDVRELVASLGLRPGNLAIRRAKIYGRDVGETYRFGFQGFAHQPVFGLARKQDCLPERSTHDYQRNRMIVAIRSVPSVPTKCIEVDSSTHTYCVSRSFIPTHNSVFAMNELILKATSGPSDAEYLYLLPLRNQAQRNVWDPFKRFVAPIPGMKLNNMRLEAVFPNGAKIYVLGSDDPESLRGLHLHGVVLDEFADMHINTWRAVRPMLTNHRGWVIWIGTPKGHNAFWSKWLQSQEAHRPTWFGEILPWNKTNAISVSEIDQMRSEMLTEEFAQEMECFPPGSLVATSNGMTAIETLLSGDLVLTHTGHLRPITAVMSKQYEGDLIVIESYGSRPLRLTPDHPVYVCDPSKQTYEWKPARLIETREWIVTPKKHPGMPIISAALAELIAWFIAEGCVSQNTITIALGSHETSFIERVQDCFTALSRDSRVKIQDNTASVYCCDVVLGDFLVSSCGSGAFNKRIPLALIAGHERLVFDTLIDGDGCISRLEGQGRHRMSYKYTTASEQLVMQVQLLGATLNLGGTYTIRSGGETFIQGRKTISGTSYCAQLYEASGYDRNDPCAKIRHAKHGILGKVHTVSREPYCGFVHNLSVTHDESYVVNNRAVHNCSFEAALVGSYYGNILADLRENGRINAEPLYRKDLPVHTCWDLGIRDRMAVWFFQLVKDEIFFIDYEEYSNYGFPEWAEILKIKANNYGYEYGTHVAPFDIKNRELGSGISRLESAEQVGIFFEQCPKQDVMDGIELCRRHLPRCRFQSIACEDGLEAMTMYRAKVDKQGQGLGPEHSVYSHAADSMRYGITHVVQVMCQPALIRTPFMRRR